MPTWSQEVGDVVEARWSYGPRATISAATPQFDPALNDNAAGDPSGAGTTQPERHTGWFGSGRSRTAGKELYQDLFVSLAPEVILKWPLPSLKKKPTETLKDAESVKGDTVPR